MEGDESLASPSIPEEPTGEVKDASPWVADWLDALCPYYMSFGISFNDFWFGDYSHFHFYVETQEIINERKNQEMWLQGLYIYNAIGAYREILPAFPAKGAKIHPYEYDLVPLTEKAAEEKKECIAAEKFQKMREYFMRGVKEGKTK